MKYTEWKEKYVEKNRRFDEGEQSKKGIFIDTKINEKAINSKTYRDKFNNLDESTEVIKSIYNESKKILKHRSKTKFEDLVFIDSVTNEVKSVTDCNIVSAVKATNGMQDMLKKSADYSIIAIYNHPNSSLPSMSDIATAWKRKYKYGLIVCHDGKLIKYSVSNDLDLNTNYNLINRNIDKLMNLEYNTSEYMELIKRIKELGVSLEVFA